MKKYLFYCMNDDLNGVILSLPNDGIAIDIASMYEAECFKLNDEGKTIALLYNPYSLFNNKS